MILHEQLVGTGLEDSDDDMKLDGKDDPDAEEQQKTSTLPVKKERAMGPPEVLLVVLEVHDGAVPDAAPILDVALEDLLRLGTVAAKVRLDEDGMRTEAHRPRRAHSSNRVTTIGSSTAISPAIMAAPTWVRTTMPL